MLMTSSDKLAPATVGVKLLILVCKWFMRQKAIILLEESRQESGNGPIKMWLTALLLEQVAKVESQLLIRSLMISNFSHPKQSRALKCRSSNLLKRHLLKKWIFHNFRVLRSDHKNPQSLMIFEQNDRNVFLFYLKPSKSIHAINKRKKSKQKLSIGKKWNQFSQREEIFLCFQSEFDVVLVHAEISSNQRPLVHQRKK